MSGTTILIIAFVLGLLAMSFAFAGGAVIVALPVAAVVILGVAAFDFNRRRKQARDIGEHREEAQADGPDFTERDQQTLTSE